MGRARGRSRSREEQACGGAASAVEVAASGDGTSSGSIGSLTPRAGMGRSVARGRDDTAPSFRRAFRGLALVFTLSFLNLVGVLLTVSALGGLGPWSGWQFVGIFGAIETASGVANVFSPNIWRLPISELQTSKRTRVKLAASALLLPHWGGLARSAAGLACLALAASHEGVGPATATLLPLTLALAWSVLAISAVFARIGVGRPDLDVVQLVIRWRRRESELHPISIGASLLQFLLGVATIPAVKLLPPSVLYQPEIAASPDALLVASVVSVALLVIVYVLWSGRITLHAPAEQQRDAEDTG
jgi:hypothetical protein